MSSEVRVLRDDVASGLAPWLKAHGFRRSRSVFTRSVDDIIHVVVLDVVLDRMHVPSPPAGISVECGVHIPEMSWFQQVEPRTIRPEHCAVRLAVEPEAGGVTHFEPRLWPAQGDSETLAGSIREALARSGLPWLDGLSSRVELLEALQDAGTAAAASPAVLRAVIHAFRGEQSEALCLLVTEARASSSREPYRDFLREVADRLGLAL